jgi:hypothetical protein
MAKRQQTFQRARRKRKAQQRLKMAVKSAQQEEQEAEGVDQQASPADEKPARASGGSTADEAETAEAPAEE